MHQMCISILILELPCNNNFHIMPFYNKTITTFAVITTICSAGCWGLLLLKDECRSFEFCMRNNPSACCVHRSKSGAGISAQVLTWKNCCKTLSLLRPGVKPWPLDCSAVFPPTGHEPSNCCLSWHFGQICLVCLLCVFGLWPCLAVISNDIFFSMCCII